MSILRAYELALIEVSLIQEFKARKSTFMRATFDRHYDGRFADKVLDYDNKRVQLSALAQAYLTTMNDIGVETWLMHGTLLGWYWNRKILPWDSDIDVMVSENSIHVLASYYNMSMYHLEVRGTETSRDYLLEINPHYIDDSLDENNKIDARWIDTETGLYIDITTLRKKMTAARHEDEDAMMVKDSHHYQYDDIYPLRESVFEETPVWIPYAYADVLVGEYGDHCLADLYHENHRSDSDQQVWVPQNMNVLTVKQSNGQR